MAEPGAPALTGTGILPAAASLPRVPSFGEVVAAHRARGDLVVQPRMGFADPDRMRQGLLATRGARAATVGTITLDSYTRVGDHDAVARALAAGADLNGYPLVDADAAGTARMLADALAPAFPVQVRHGSADPRRIVRTLLARGLHATEGGPVSYCLPYSRLPLVTAVEHWRQTCETLAAAREHGSEPHLETFGGCMMGQLCPPALLVALSVLEGMFFRQHGLRCISFSYAQQTHAGQDEEAVAALRRLIRRYVPDARTHVVVYTYMGVYPRTPAGALGLLAESARLAVRTGASRLIVKTEAEAHRIPTIAENVAALEHAAAASRSADPGGPVEDTGIHAQAQALIEAVLTLDDDLGRALTVAFARGHLDVPYCLHPDNAGRARGYLDRDGRLQWQRIGAMPLGDLVTVPATEPMTSSGLLDALQYVQRTFDDRFDTTRRYITSTGTWESHMTTTPLDSRITAGQRPPGTRAHLTSPVTQAALRIQNSILAGSREHLSTLGFQEMMPPIIGPVTDPGVRGAKQIDVDFYGHRYKLMTSVILYKQASLLAFDKIFYVAPNVRLEPLETADTGRHLAEFTQIDVEVADASREDILDLLQGLLRHIVRHVLRESKADLTALGRDPDVFEALLRDDFERISHPDAVAHLRRLRHLQSTDAEIDWEGERLISEQTDRPFFIVGYPKGSRGFTDGESSTEPGVLRNFDLIAPDGYGELCSGGERTYEYRRLIERMRETGENPAKYKWYLDLAREGLRPSAGFGLGLERVTRYLAGLDAAWQGNAFPKLPGIVSP
ncbi:amino acid--tRNA ligase-related protein [Dactylosporangium sp. NPDC005555]|uniref:amino acid--tRNA ligase-related protein n=1 Tax=Dactylosporangium sp. NPDC005555 TaxID=3154889 RepID=UPI0033A1CBFC